MSDIPEHIQRRATEIYTSKRCTIKEAYDEAFLEERMAKEGFPLGMENPLADFFRRKR